MTSPLPKPHQARKRFGQNFLHDKNIIDRIVKSMQPHEAIPIIEVGPGLGALTEPLLATGASVTAIEIDRDLSLQLREKFSQLSLIEADVLEVNIPDIAKKLGATKVKVVGNLPYNISTPLIFHLLESKACIDSMYFMLQREVVERMAATQGSKEYGKLSIMVQYHCDVSPLFHISPQSFHPAPKVESTFVLLKPRPFHVTALDLSHFEKMVSYAFQQRRKTLKNAIKLLLPSNGMPEFLLQKLSLRAEDVSVTDYVIMSNELVKSS